MRPIIEPYQPGDQQEILELFRRVFQEARTADRWQWENLDNPAGPSLFALLKEDGRVLGHLCLQAARLSVQGREVTAGQRINFMLDPASRRRGFYPQLFHKVVEQARTRGWAFTFGFPNAPALKALQKIHPAAPVAQVPRFVKFFRGRAIAQRKIRQPALAGAAGRVLDGLLWLQNRRRQAADDHVVPLERFDERFDRLWQQAAPSLGVATVRDQAYLNWRYVDAPLNYRVLAFVAGDEVRGYIVLRLGPGEMGHVVDLLAREETGVVPALLSAAETAARAHCEMLSCWCLDRGQVSRHLRQRGFFSLPGQNTLAISEIQGSRESSRVLWDKHSWYVMIGDSDYI